MNLWLRLLHLWLAGRSRSPVPPLGPCRTPFRVSLFDLDLVRHMNNGRYFTIMDLARVDLMRRSGFLARLNAARFFPVVTSETMCFRKSLNWRDAFEIETAVVSWDEKSLMVTQRFFVGETEVATALVQARFLRRSGGSVPTSEIIALLDTTVEPPMLTPELAAWIAQHRSALLPLRVRV
jgi:YbgC/YbaW family acyl-CoA thioester hydrolase